MQGRNYSRRVFIRQHSLTGLGLVLAASVFPGTVREGNNIEFISPVDGDVLHKYDGVITGDSIKTIVKVAAPANSTITINNVPAKNVNGIFTAEISLAPYQNIIEVRNGKTGEKKNITVFWLKNLADKYRLSIDDAVWFLKDIHLNAGRYQSVFENPFLGFLKQVHDTYGTKVHINIFYETDGFNLSQMTDKFKDEWRKNAAWLRLSFHAKAELPDDPYKKAGYARVKQECEAVMEQIKRFAGNELNDTVTTLHWGEVPVHIQ